MKLKKIKKIVFNLIFLVVITCLVLSAISVVLYFMNPGPKMWYLESIIFMMFSAVPLFILIIIYTCLSIIERKSNNR